MALMRSGNPTLNNSTFSGTPVAAGEEPMTIRGAVNKTAILRPLAKGRSRNR